MSDWLVDEFDESGTCESLTRTKDIIGKLEDAILVLSTGGVQQYSLDTGQTRQNVTRANLTELRRALEYFERRRDKLCAVAASDGVGGGSFYARPGW